MAITPVVPVTVVPARTAPRVAVIDPAEATIFPSVAVMLPAEARSPPVVATKPVPAVTLPATDGEASRLTVKVPTTPAVFIFVPPSMLMVPAIGVAAPASDANVDQVPAALDSRLRPAAVCVIVTEPPVDVKSDQAISVPAISVSKNWPEVPREEPIAPVPSVVTIPSV